MRFSLLTALIFFSVALNAGTPCAGFVTSHYGYKDDPFLDSNTSHGHGTFGDLCAGAVALTDTLATQLSVQPGDWIEMVDEDGHLHLGRYVDRAPQPDPRLDIYDPHGSERLGEPFTVKAAYRVPSPYAF